MPGPWTNGRGVARVVRTVLCAGRAYNGLPCRTEDCADHFDWAHHSGDTPIGRDTDGKRGWVKDKKQGVVLEHEPFQPFSLSAFQKKS